MTLEKSLPQLGYKSNPCVDDERQKLRGMLYIKQENENYTSIFFEGELDFLYESFEANVEYPFFILERKVEDGNIKVIALQLPEATILN